MANAAKMLARAPVRALLVGYPGSGKTGSLASLLNAGFKMRYLDFDHNLEPLFRWTNPDKLANLDFMQFEDKMRQGGKFMEPIGIPTAFPDALKAMDNWKYTEEDGTVVDLGSSKTWGLDTVVVLDSLTKMGEAAFRRAMKLLNKTPMTTTDRVWGLAMAEQAAFIDKLTSPSNGFHVLVLAHLKMIGPKDIRNGDTPLTEDIKKQAANLMETRLYPRALGRELPQTIGGEFPIIIEFTKKILGTKVTRYLNTTPRAELDLKYPGVTLPDNLDISNGMLQIFKALSPESVALVSGNSSGLTATI